MTSEYQERPDAVGWWECRHTGDKDFRVCRWWDGATLFVSPQAQEIDWRDVRNYRDFIPLAPLVLGDEELRAAAAKYRCLVRSEAPDDLVFKAGAELDAALAPRPQPEEQR